MIHFPCPHCRFACSAPESSAGKVLRCPRCSFQLSVPEITPDQGDWLSRQSRQLPAWAWVLIICVALCGLFLLMPALFR